MKKKRGILFAAMAIVMAGVSITGCSLGEKKESETEIVWYLKDPGNYGADGEECEPYQEVNSARFEHFNERLKEIGIPAKVIFKYAPDFYEFSEQPVKELVEKDESADIVYFSSKEYQEYLVLDDYSDGEDMKKAKEALLPEIWDANCIGGKTYQIPKGNVNIYETVYCFYKPFLEEYQIEVNEEEIKQMSPKKVIEWLLPYFEEERVLDGKYYLTSAQDVDYWMYYLDKFAQPLKGMKNNIILDLETKQVTDVFSNATMKEYFELCQWIYKNDIDGHESQNVLSARPIFSLNTIPNIAQLQNENSVDTSVWQQVCLGNSFLCSSEGNGVLKNSNHKELAVQVLAASVYDEELTNLMIYGIKDKDYVLEDGHAVCQEERMLSSMGTFQGIGNNLIAYPNKLEIAQKKEVTAQLLREIPMRSCSNFVPEWNEEMFRTASEIAEICQGAVRKIRSSEISDMEAYLEEQQKMLRQAGSEELIAALQRQVDNWEE